MTITMQSKKKIYVVISFVVVVVIVVSHSLSTNNEPLLCEGCSLLIISGSLFAMLTGGQRSPWCEVVSLLKFAFVTSSIGSIGKTQLHIVHSSIWGQDFGLTIGGLFLKQKELVYMCPNVRKSAKSLTLIIYLFIFTFIAVVKAISVIDRLYISCILFSVVMNTFIVTGLMLIITLSWHSLPLCSHFFFYLADELMMITTPHLVSEGFYSGLQLSSVCSGWLAGDLQKVLCLSSSWPHARPLGWQGWCLEVFLLSTNGSGMGTQCFLLVNKMR